MPLIPTLVHHNPVIHSHSLQGAKQLLLAGAVIKNCSLQFTEFPKYYQRTQILRTEFRNFRGFLKNTMDSHFGKDPTAKKVRKHWAKPDDMQTDRPHVTF